jgi:hypothetical protein
VYHENQLLVYCTHLGHTVPLPPETLAVTIFTINTKHTVILLFRKKRRKRKKSDKMAVGILSVQSTIWQKKNIRGRRGIGEWKISV